MQIFYPTLEKFKTSTDNQLLSRGSNQQSVKLEMSVVQRHELNKLMLDHSNIVQELKQHFYADEMPQIGNDEKCYTLKQLRNQLKRKQKSWTSQDKSAHIYTQYVERHNMQVVLVAYYYEDTEGALKAKAHMNKWYVDYGQTITAPSFFDNIFTTGD